MGDLDFLTGYDHPSGTPGAAAPPVRDSSLDFLTDDHAGATPAAPNLGFSDIPGSLWAGTKQGLHDVGQTFAGGESGPADPAAAPFEWGDIAHPGSGLSKFAYRVGQGSPTIAGGVAGGFGGTAAAGPIGGIAGGAAGAALGNALQTMGPVFERELKATPGDPEGAWDRAFKSATVSGLFSGAAWGLFPVKFFEGPVKSALFQVLGIQPGLAAAHQATENVMHDRPLLEGTPEAMVEGAVGTALPMAGHAAIRGVGRKTGLLPATADQLAVEAAQKAAKAEPPTVADLDAIADQHYKDIRNQKITYSGASELARLRDHLRSTLINAGISPKASIYNEIFDAIGDLTESRRDPYIDPATGKKANHPPDWTDLDAVRKRIADAAQSNEKRVRRAAAIALRGDSDTPGSTGLMDWFADANAQERAGVHPSLAPELAEKMRLARSYYRAARGMEAFEKIIQRADNSSNDRNVTLRNEIRKIVNGSPAKQAQFPPEVIDLMREGLHRGFWQAAAHASKLFDPHSSFGLFTNFMSHNMFGPEGLLAMPAAMMARHIGMKPLRNVEEQTPRIIGAQPTGKPVPKAPTRSERTRAYYSPYVGPVVPQAQKRGGKIRAALRAAGGGIHMDDGSDPGQPDMQQAASQEEYGPPIEPFMAQQAREGAAYRQQQAVQPAAGERQEGPISWNLQSQGQSLADQLMGLPSQIYHHPETLIGGTEGEAASPFYSALERTINSPKAPKNASGGDWLNFLRGQGVKQDELQWTGVEDYLKNRQPKDPNQPELPMFKDNPFAVSKQDLAQFAEKNRTQVEAVPQVQNELSPRDQERLDDRMSEIESHMHDEWAHERASEETPSYSVMRDPETGDWYFEDDAGRGVIERDFATRRDAERAAEEWRQQEWSSIFYDYAERAYEHADQMPMDAAQIRAQAMQELGFDVGGYSEYTLPGGENYQEWLLKHTNHPNPFEADDHWGGEPGVFAHVRTTDREIDGKKTLFLEEVQSDWHQQGREKGYQSNKPITYEVKGAGPWAVYDSEGNFVRDYNNRENAIRDVEVANRGQRYGNEAPLPQDFYDHFAAQRNRVPDAPFKDTKAWAGVAMKRMIREAAEKGYDKIAWTDGQVHTNRWGPGRNGEREKGFANFYDKILPSVAGKIGGKYGAKPYIDYVGTQSFQPVPAGVRGRNIHVMDITPALRKAAMEEGFPLYKRGGAVKQALQLVRRRLDDGGDAGDAPDYIGMENHVPQSMPEGMHEPLPLESTEKAPSVNQSADSDNPFATLGRNYMGAMSDAWRGASDMTSAGYGDIGQGDIIGGVPKVLLGSAAAYATPFTAASKAFVEDPVTQATGNPQAGERAGFLAGMPFGGPEAAAAKKAIFLPALGADARQAAKMSAAGASPDEIWDKLKVFEDKAGNWRRESLGPTSLKMSPQELMDTQGRGPPLTMRDVLDAPHVYDEKLGKKAGNLPLYTFSNPNTPTRTMAYYQPYIIDSFTGKPTGDPHYWLRTHTWKPHGPEPRDSEEVLSDLYHELQHGVDQPAGFLHKTGGDPMWLDTKNSNDPVFRYYDALVQRGTPPQEAFAKAEHQRYRNSFHEPIARAAAARADLFNLHNNASGPESARRWMSGNPRNTIENDSPYRFQLVGEKFPRADGGSVDATPFTPRHGNHLTPQQILEIRALFEPSFANRLYAYGEYGDPIEDRRGEKLPIYQRMKMHLLANAMRHGTGRLDSLPPVPPPDQSPDQGSLARDAGYYDVQGALQ